MSDLERDGVSSNVVREFLKAPGSRRELRLRRVSSLRRAEMDSIVFASGQSSMELALASAAGLILASAESDDHRVVVVENPRKAFAEVYERFIRPVLKQGVHPTAVVENRSNVGPGCLIEAGAFIAAGVRMGAGCWIGPRAVLLAGTILGDRVRVQAGAILGSDGFGYVRAAGGYLAFPQIGTLEVGDDVEIGAGSTIDRGALESTRVGRGTKIDNLVHIAHNCQIGEDVLIAAQVGIAGSSVVGDRAILGGQVGIGEHATVGEGVILGGSAGVLSHKRLEGDGQVFWGVPARPVRDYLRDMARMRRD